MTPARCGMPSASCSACPFCLDMWVATGFTIGVLFAPRFTRVLAATFTALTGADFLHLLYARAQQAAQG